MKKILVTGTEGDVGKVLLPQLAKTYDATGFDIRPHQGTMKTVQGDLTKYEDVAPALEGVEAIVHMAALLPKPNPMPAQFADLNVKAPSVLLQAALDKKVKRFVYCSTVWASGHGQTEPYLPIDEEVPCRPICMYGQTKWLGELMAEWYGRQCGIETVIIRFCGFQAVKGYNTDGRIDWPNADVKGIFMRYLSGTPKLMNPVDLGMAFGAAIENRAAVGQRFIIGCYQPYVAADAAGLRSMPAAIIERYYPGAPKFLEEIGIEVPPIPYFYCYEKARTRLGFRSQHDLGDVIQSYRKWRESK